METASIGTHLTPYPANHSASSKQSPYASEEKSIKIQEESVTKAMETARKEKIALVFVVQPLKACKIALGDFLGVFSPDCCRMQSQFVL